MRGTTGLFIGCHCPAVGAAELLRSGRFPLPDKPDSGTRIFRMCRALRVIVPIAGGRRAKISRDFLRQVSGRFAGRKRQQRQCRCGHLKPGQNQRMQPGGGAGWQRQQLHRLPPALGGEHPVGGARRATIRWPSSATDKEQNHQPQAAFGHDRRATARSEKRPIALPRTSHAGVANAASPYRDNSRIGNELRHRRQVSRHAPWCQTATPQFTRPLRKVTM